MVFFRVLFGLLPVLTANQLLAQKGLRPISFAQVQIVDQFWREKLTKIAEATLPACIEQTEVQTGRIRNFERAALGEGSHEGIYYDDSDVYKALEAMAYSLQNHPDSQLEDLADRWIAKIAAAQRPDGYLNTYYTLTGLDSRWTDMEKHETYCGGHLIEAGIAYHNATGKRLLLDVAIRFADHMDTTFRLSNRPWVTGHQEVELALVKLYRHTGVERYLQLAQWFLDQRGRGHGKGMIWDRWDASYCQDDLPVKEARQIRGHAVRAMYLYTGAADVAAVTGDTGYWHAMQAVWEDVVQRHLYITGGIGATGRIEGFSVPFDLPNETAYAETCASVGMVFWNQRMNLLSGDARYIDVLERALYNGALDGLSADGDLFFYSNPLASSGQHHRRAWFGTACCPSNIARLTTSVGDYIYTQTDSAIFINLFIGSHVEVSLPETQVHLSMTTEYPWQGGGAIALSVGSSERFTLGIRIPGWLGREAVPGGLYRFVDRLDDQMILHVNGKKVSPPVQDGYALLHRQWSDGDIVEWHLPMPVRKLVSSDSVELNLGRVAFQRGPFVYAFEGTDNGDHIWNSVVDAKAVPRAVQRPDLFGGIYVIEVAGKTLLSVDGEQVRLQDILLTGVPYYLWNNRGNGPMQVWLPERIGRIRIESASPH